VTSCNAAACRPHAILFASKRLFVLFCLSPACHSLGVRACLSGLKSKFIGEATTQTKRENKHEKETASAAKATLH